MTSVLATYGDSSTSNSGNIAPATFHQPGHFPTLPRTKQDSRDQDKTFPIISLKKSAAHEGPVSFQTIS